MTITSTIRNDTYLNWFSNRIFVAGNPGLVYIIDASDYSVVDTVMIESFNEGITYDLVNYNIYAGDISDGILYVIAKSSDTEITSATDGNSIPIGNEGSTLSDKITFIFESTSTNSAFECSLDNQVFSSYTSPLTYNNLNSGTHTFQVASQGDSTSYDPSFVSFLPSR